MVPQTPVPVKHAPMRGHHILVPQTIVPVKRFPSTGNIVHFHHVQPICNPCHDKKVLPLVIQANPRKAAPKIL